MSSATMNRAVNHGPAEERRTFNPVILSIKANGGSQADLTQEMQAIWKTLKDAHNNGARRLGIELRDEKMHGIAQMAGRIGFDVVELPTAKSQWKIAYTEFARYYLQDGVIDLKAMAKDEKGWADQLREAQSSLARPYWDNNPDFAQLPEIINRASQQLEDFGRAREFIASVKEDHHRIAQAWFENRKEALKESIAKEMPDVVVLCSTHALAVAKDNDLKIVEPQIPLLPPQA